MNEKKKHFRVNILWIVSKLWLYPWNHVRTLHFSYTFSNLGKLCIRFESSTSTASSLSLSLSSDTMCIHSKYSLKRQSTCISMNRSHTHTHLASDFTSNTFWYRYIFLTELSKSMIKQVRDSMKQWNDSNFDLSALEVNEIFFFFARSVKRCRDDINY